MATTTEYLDQEMNSIMLKDYADMLDMEMQTHFINVWDAEQDVIHMDAMEEAIYLIAARIFDIGNCASVAIQNGSQDLAHYNICYTWAADAKAFCILWRNIMFEEQKALLLVSEGKAEIDSYQTLKSKSKAVLKEAASDLIKKLKANVKLKASSTIEVQKLSLQTDPWPVYKQQIASIAPQCEQLVNQFKSLWNTSGLYVLVKSNFNEDFSNHKTSTEQFKLAINEINSSLEFAEKVDATEIVKKLNTLNEKFLSDRSFQDMQKNLNSDLKDLPKLERYVIEAQGSQLAYEDINLKDRTNLWLGSELLPLLNNFYAIRANIKNQFNLSLSNIKNRLVVGRDEGVELDRSELRNALSTFVKRLEKSEQQISEIRKDVGQQLQDFALHKIYDGNFLNLSIASTLNQYNQTGKQRFEGIKNWIADKGIFVKQFQDSVEVEERLSMSEKLVRVINARKPRTGSSHYTNMFKTRGYIGESFMVGRATELTHIKSIIDNWRLGFRGAVMITGTRFSGKTLLAEVISQRHFTDKTIKLVAGKKLQVGGRHLDPTMNLAEQLDFVVKYSLQEKVLIFLDDLHQWHNEDHSLLQNMRAMSKTIDRYSNKLFFMVCLNNWQKERLNIALNLNGIFQAEINTDKVSFDELHQAIVIRHSATHTELVDNNGEEVSTKAFLSKLKYIHTLTHGNIGESMLRWAQDIEMYDDDKVKYVLDDYTIPEFLTPSSSILLKTILMYGSTNEYNLRRLFGPAFQYEYKPILQRMINVGVVIRNVNGKLEIRKSIVNDIAALLETTTNFTYLKKLNTA